MFGSLKSENPEIRTKEELISVTYSGHPRIPPAPVPNLPFGSELRAKGELTLVPRGLK